MRWGSLPEFGAVTQVRIWVGASSGVGVFASFDPSEGGQGMGGETTLDLVGQGLLGPTYLRAELLTADGGSGHRAYTNPIWARFEVGTDVAEDDTPAGMGPRLAASPNPFAEGIAIRYALPAAGPVTLEVCDPAGRCVARLPAVAGGAGWDGRDEAGRACPSGAYTLRLSAGAATRTLRLIRIR